MRVLANPTLVALSGEQAEFLVGGEYPIPVVQGGGGGSSTSVTIEYREYGIRLRFEPTVLGDVFTAITALGDEGWEPNH